MDAYLLASSTEPFLVDLSDHPMGERPVLHRRHHRRGASVLAAGEGLEPSRSGWLLSRYTNGRANLLIHQRRLRFDYSACPATRHLAITDI